MDKTRLTLLGIVLIAGAFLGGLVMGTRGKAPAERDAAAYHMDLMLQTGVARALHARVALYNLNFGEASRDLERAKGMFEQARGRLTETRREADARVLERVIALLNEAQQLTGALDQGANTKVAEALTALPDLPLTAGAR
jgi:hypothetical protein